LFNLTERGIVHYTQVILVKNLASKYTIGVSKSTRDTLREISRLSGIPVTQILEEWANGIASILEDVDSNRISLLSRRYKDTKLCITYIAPLYIQVERELCVLKSDLQTEVSGKLGEIKGEVEKHE
jgi:hypothetical protein